MRYSDVIVGMDTSPTYAPKVNKTSQANKEVIVKTLNNNKKKFDFLATETTPDYRPRSIIIEKEEKTNTNQKTQFQQLQQLFNNMGVHPETIENDIPLIKDISKMEDNFNTVNEVIRLLMMIFIPPPFPSTPTKYILPANFLKNTLTAASRF